MLEMATSSWYVRLLVTAELPTKLKSRSQRRPRFRVKRLETLQSSWKYVPNCLVPPGTFVAGSPFEIDIPATAPGVANPCGKFVLSVVIWLGSAPKSTSRVLLNSKYPPSVGLKM